MKIDLMEMGALAILSVLLRGNLLHILRFHSFLSICIVVLYVLGFFFKNDKNRASS